MSVKRLAAALALSFVLAGCSSGGSGSVGRASNIDPGSVSSSTVEPQETADDGGNGVEKPRARIAVPKESRSDSDEMNFASRDSDVTTDLRFERETTMTIEPGKDRKWQNAPSAEQVAAYKKSREAAPPPVQGEVGGGGMPVLDTNGLTTVR